MSVAWTATHRFVVLAMHVAHQGDGEVQDEDQVALVDACMRIGTEAHVADDEMVAMVDEACNAYQQARHAGVEGSLVDEAVESLGGTFATPMCVSLLRELREIAKAHGGVNPDEHDMLVDLRESWGIKSLA